ncbi:MAG TPA: MoaD/ThiS family protein [Gemmatimonadaceae bacterium]|jgi:molybdopterin converting factor subunit 1|nr:MoaD/ThiS family protein [Gemmatimonadaceae bacterium]
MTVTVLLFASYADALGERRMPIDVPDSYTVGDVVRRVRAMAGSARLPAEPMVAVNEEYAKSDRRLAAGDEVAIIPPVAGG